MTSQNTHFTDYKVLEAESAEGLSSAVMHAIHNRWQPYGDMVIAKKRNGSEERVTLLQPMVQQAELFR